MRRCPQFRSNLVCGAIAVTAVLAISGCSHPADNSKHAAVPSPSRPAPSQGPANGATGLPPGAIGLSPGGVTTRVDVPAESTEDEYFQACHAAKLWMVAQPKTNVSPFEAYLAMLQASTSGSAGTWNVAWANLTPERQAAVITAAEAAAADGCG